MGISIYFLQNNGLIVHYPPNSFFTGRGHSLKIYKAVFIFMPVAIVLAFLWAPVAAGLGDTSKIVYFHVPISWVSVLAYIVSGIISIIYLADKNKKFINLEEKAYNSAIIGFLFTILSTVTGTIWAKISWGSYWSWDPRQTSITILLLIYLTYFSLRYALHDNRLKGKICACYLILIMIIVPFFIFVLPRMSATLHPNPIINPDKQIHVFSSMRIVLFLSLISFTLLYFYLFFLKNRVSRIGNKVLSKLNN
ncbi:cytochrome c biogenesis protein [Spirochaetota bacterium]